MRFYLSTIIFLSSFQYGCVSKAKYLKDVENAKVSSFIDGCGYCLRMYDFKDPHEGIEMP